MPNVNTASYFITRLYASNTEELQGALERVAEIRAEGARQPITIALAEGDYFFTETMKIGPEISAVTVEPQGNAKVRFIGGERIQNFCPDTYNGVSCLSASVEEGFTFSDFYVNGQRAEYTRYPEKGFLNPLKMENELKQMHAGSKWIIAKPGDIPAGLKNPQQVMVNFCHYWIDEHTPIESYDEESGRITFLYRSRLNLDGMIWDEPGFPRTLEYYLENLAEAFAKPNQWYLDNGKVYYIPRDESITPETIEAYAPRIHKFFDICGTENEKVEHVQFRNIHFMVTRGEYGSRGSWQGESVIMASDGQAVADADGIIRFRHAIDCAIKDCALHNYGLHGINIEAGCSHILLSGLDMFDGGGGGVKMGGCAIGGTPENETHDCTVEDCRILHCGKRYFASCGVLMMHVSRCTVAHCDIGYIYYTGISAGWTWSYGDTNVRDLRILKNHIHHLGMGVLSDMGGVYLLGRQPGTVVAGNVIHDISSRYYGGHGIYTDQASSFITVENNIVYRVSEFCYDQHFGAANTVRNNIFAFGKESAVGLTRHEEHVGILFENNIMVTEGRPMFSIRDEHFKNNSFVSRHNLLWDLEGKFLYRGVKNSDGEAVDVNAVKIGAGEENPYAGLVTIAACQTLGFDADSVVADPGFEDLLHYDFTLKADSCASQIGFRPIDTSDVGPRK